jgi:hypothetical protein
MAYRNFMIYATHSIMLSGEIKKVAMRRQEIQTEFWWGNFLRS